MQELKNKNVFFILLEKKGEKKSAKPQGKRCKVYNKYKSILCIWFVDAFAVII